MRALVTGASGFIGTHLVGRLIETGHQVRALVQESSRVDALDPSCVEIIRGDVRRRRDMLAAADGCDVIFHLAVVRGNRELSIEATDNLVHAAIESRAGRVVFPSTARVYGTKQNRIDEHTPVRPDSRHGKLRLAAEQLLVDGLSKTSTQLVIARLPLVLGAGGVAWRGVFDSIATGRFRMIGEGDNFHQPVDVRDAAEGLRLCGVSSGIDRRVYILAGPEAVPLRVMIEAIARLLDVPTPPSRIPVSALRVYRFLNGIALSCIGRDLPRFNRVQLFLQNYRFDLSRARHELGYAPAIGLEETLRRTTAWYVQQGRWPGRQLRPARVS